MLTCLSSWREQPVPNKRPDKSVCQKKRYCQGKQDFIAGDIDFASFDAKFGTCVLLLWAGTFNLSCRERNRCWFCRHPHPPRNGFPISTHLIGFIFGLFEAAGCALETVGSLL